MPLNLSNINFKSIKSKIIYLKPIKQNTVAYVYRKCGNTIILYVMGRSEVTNMFNICREYETVVVERWWCCQAICMCGAYC